MLIPPNILKAAARAASRDACRYQLTGIHIERGAGGFATATATHGRQLLHVRWSDEGLREEFPDVGATVEAVPGAHAILPLAAVRDVVKMAPARPAKPILSLLHVEEASLNGKIRIAATDLESRKDVTIAAIEGTFPDVSGVVPSPARALRVKVNARLMANMLEAVIEATPDRGAKPDERDLTVDILFPVEPASGQVEKAIRIRRSTPADTLCPGEAIGLVMPLRLDTPPAISDLEKREAELEADLRAVREELAGRRERGGVA